MWLRDLLHVVLDVLRGGCSEDWSSTSPSASVPNRPCGGASRSTRTPSDREREADAATAGARRDEEHVPPGRLARPPHPAHRDPRLRDHARARPRHPSRGRDRPAASDRLERAQAGAAAGDLFDLDRLQRGSSPRSAARRTCEPSCATSSPSWSSRATEVEVEADELVRTSTPRRSSGSSRTCSRTPSATPRRGAASGYGPPGARRSCSSSRTRATASPTTSSGDLRAVPSGPRTGAGLARRPGRALPRRAVRRVAWRHRLGGGPARRWLLVPRPPARGPDRHAAAVAGPNAERVA